MISKNSPATHDPIIKNPGDPPEFAQGAKADCSSKYLDPGLRLALMAKTIANILTYHNLYIYYNYVCIYIHIYIYTYIYIYILSVCVCTCGKTVIIPIKTY